MGRESKKERGMMQREIERGRTESEICCRTLLLHDTGDGNQS